MKSVINEEHYALMKKACYKNLRSVMSSEEMDSFIYYNYAKCLKKYDPNKGVAKFTTYIYKSIDYASRKIYLKKIRSKEKQTYDLHFYSKINPRDVNSELFEILDSLKDIDKESHDILVNKFLYGMTNAEIGKANGYCGEWARQKVKKALKKCQKIVYS